MQRGKRTGFNLVEITIVLAVIGLIIGGIYIAASAVRENNRRQAAVKQVLQISLNVRTLYAGQPPITDQGAYNAPLMTDPQVIATGIMPGDVLYDGTQFMGVYGRVALVTNNILGEFELKLFNVSQGACALIYSQLFSSGSMKRNYGVVGLNVNGVGVDPNADVTAAATADLCNQPA